jgi:hypothetical protein
LGILGIHKELCSLISICSIIESKIPDQTFKLPTDEAFKNIFYLKYIIKGSKPKLIKTTIMIKKYVQYLKRGQGRTGHIRRWDFSHRPLEVGSSYTLRK